MVGRTNVADLISKKGWIKVDYDQHIWIPCPPGFGPQMSKDEWASGFAEIWWDASGLKHNKRVVRLFAKMLLDAHKLIYTEQPCHLALIHIPDVRSGPLAVCFGIWEAGSSGSQLRELVHADDPVAIEPPIVEEVWTENLGTGLKSMLYQRLGHGRGILGVLQYAWRSEEYETALHIYTACSDLGRLQRAIPDIDAMTKTITIVPSTEHF